MVKALSLVTLLWASMTKQGHPFPLSFPEANPTCMSLKDPQGVTDARVHHISRRQLLSRTATTCTFISVVMSGPPASNAVEAPSTVTLHLERGDRAGIELYDAFSGDLSRQVAVIKSVSPEASSKNVMPGMVITNFKDSKAVVGRLRNGPYPVELTMISDIATQSNNVQGDFVVRTISEGSGDPSRRGDILEFVYEARMGSRDGPVYDSSAKRGTGLPYQYVLGSGDLIPGVDAGLVKMRPGEVRQLELPPPLGYGSKGSKLFQIPPNTRLYWTVKMIRVTSMFVSSSP